VLSVILLFNDWGYLLELLLVLLLFCHIYEVYNKGLAGEDTLIIALVEEGGCAHLLLNLILFFDLWRPLSIFFGSTYHVIGLLLLFLIFYIKKERSNIALLLTI